jgi:pseudaminic acid cytidylyltransferase
MKRIAIIPARGGSKRIPRKNIKLFFGRPIIHYVIDLARESGLFEKIFVSTDDEEIAEVAIAGGAEVPFLRDPENADDFATTSDVLVEVLKYFTDYEVGCCIYPTSALLTQFDLSQSLKKFNQGDFLTLFPVVRFGYPIDRCVIRNDDNVVLRWPETEALRSQDLPTCYHDAGLFYWFRTDYLVKSKSLFSSRSAFYEVDEIKSQDIDNYSDWELAELKFKLLRSRVK